jgi:hypothetical protein
MPIALDQLLLADIGGVLSALITLGALIFWVIQKIAEENKAKQKRAQRPAAPPARAAVQGGAQADQQPAGQQADALRNQVEEFLRRANQGNQPKQGAPQARKPAPPVREIELLVDEELSPAPRRAVGSPLGTMQSRAADREVPVIAPSDKRPERRPVTPRKRKSLAEQADERAAARTKSMAQHASSLGRRIITEDQQFDDQLKAKFDHTVGTLTASTVSASESVPVARDTPASQIAAMLANPDGVRQAVVLNEVLSRPTDRW